MRKLLIAYVALGLLAVASTAKAQTPDHVAHDAVAATVEGVQADAVVADTIVDSHSIMQPMSQPSEAIQGEAAVIAQPSVVHQHQHQPVHYHHHPQCKPAKKQNCFQKLLELERKKNAWLKKTFLGK